MKLTKLTIHRLTLEKGCGCAATREYEDGRYQKPVAEGKFTPCEKHKTQKAIVEFAGEMLLESLDKEAETAGKSYTSPAAQRLIAEGDSGGVTATGESVQAMGVSNLPKRGGESPLQGKKRDPLSITKVSVERPSTKPAMAVAAGGFLPDGIIVKDEGGVEISTEIGVEAVEDLNLSAYVEDAIGGLDLDKDDMKDAGVPQSALKDAGGD